MAANSRVQRKSKPKPQQQPVNQIDRSVSPLIHLVRLTICGFGASAIAGTTISVINPPKQQIPPPAKPFSPQPKLTPLEHRLKSTPVIPAPPKPTSNDRSLKIDK
jgi:hypothetical protein